MGALLECLFFKNGVDKVDKSDIPSDLWSIKINDLEGYPVTLSNFLKNNKLFIFVNVACK